LFRFGGAKIEQKSKPPKLFAKKNQKKSLFRKKVATPKGREVVLAVSGQPSLQTSSACGHSP